MDSMPFGRSSMTLAATHVKQCPSSLLGVESLQASTQCQTSGFFVEDLT